MWKLRNFFLTFFGQNFRESITFKVTILLKWLLNNWCDELLFRWKWIFHFSTLSKCAMHSVKITETWTYSHTWQKFRQTNVFTNKLIWRKMFSVRKMEIHCHTHFNYKNFVKVTFLLKKILKSWFDEIFNGSQYFLFFHTVTAQCGKMKNLVSPKNISSNQLFSIFYSKNITFTKFLPKMRESKLS